MERRPINGRARKFKFIFISGKTKVHTTFGREEAPPHSGKNSEASPGPSESLPVGKGIYDSGY
jgi:hypothetical protein